MAKGRMTTRGRKAMPSRRTTVAKPYGGSRYGNDAYVKVEAIEPLATPAVGTSADIFSTMRVTVPQALSPGNSYLLDQPEMNAFRVLYARYEVVGMKAEVTLNPLRTFASANLSGGFAPRMPSIALFPSEENNVAYPMQKDCNTQG